jgi:hypothetical protein
MLKRCGESDAPRLCSAVFVVHGFIIVFVSVKKNIQHSKGKGAERRHDQSHDCNIIITKHLDKKKSYML